jgi:phosphatidylserine decarboxylase
MTSGWLLQHLLPKDAISAVIYRVARSERQWLVRPLMGWFARTYRVDLSEAQHPELDSYRTFNDFFTRGLRSGARLLAGDRDTVVSPADGTLTQFGTIEADTLLQAKGRSYSLAALLGESGAAVDALRGGSYCTIYLAPHNYHRVHAPLGGALERTRYIPGRRFSVSRATAAAIDRLFCRNERVACWFATGAGPMVVVLVGALNVSSVSTFNRGEIASGAARHWQEDPPVPIERGAEIGRFNLGSTVIALFAPGAVRWDPRLADGMAVAMGTQLGRIEDRAAQVD